MEQNRAATSVPARFWHRGGRPPSACVAASSEISRAPVSKACLVTRRVRPRSGVKFTRTRSMPLLAPRCPVARRPLAAGVWSLTAGLLAASGWPLLPTHERFESTGRGGGRTAMTGVHATWALVSRVTPASCSSSSTKCSPQAGRRHQARPAPAPALPRAPRRTRRGTPRRPAALGARLPRRRRELRVRAPWRRSAWSEERPPAASAVRSWASTTRAMARGERPCVRRARAARQDRYVGHHERGPLDRVVARRAVDHDSVERRTHARELPGLVHRRTHRHNRWRLAASL